MIYSKSVNDLINKIHKRSLRVVYETEDKNFQDLLSKGSSWTSHENNIHILLIEIYKSLKNIMLPIMPEFFYLKVTPHSPQNNNLLKLSITNTRHNTQTLCFKGILYGTQSQIDIKL